jgi:hypothetical protein
MKPVMAAGQTPVGPLLQAFFIDYLYGQKRASARTVESYRDTFRGSVADRCKRLLPHILNVPRTRSSG